MCGIFGLIAKPATGASSAQLERAISHLARAAESRGKDSSGVVLQRGGRGGIQVIKGNLRITELFETAAVQKALRETVGAPAASPDEAFLVMGHSRLVTNGSQLDDANNQPVIKSQIIGLHNGIITNDSDLWDRNPHLKREYEIDTEALLTLCGDGLQRGFSIDEAIATTAGAIRGTFSVALLFQRLSKLALASNNGSLYILTNAHDFLAFASEAHTLAAVHRKLPAGWRSRAVINQVAGDRCVLASLTPFFVEERTTARCPLPQDAEGAVYGGRDGIATRDFPALDCMAVSGKRPKQELVLDTAVLAREAGAARESGLLEWNIERIQNLRRCTRCILPETFPFISFDASGVCNYCRNYRIKNQPKPFDDLAALVEPYRSRDGKPDCIVPFSGGRDSSYALHVIKYKLGLNPIAFTYDWGMVTDLGRRNIARVCGKMGVENIIVAADIYRKRDNIRRNVLAWLRRPHLGMVPLFMAGDKYFYYYSSQTQRQTGIRLNIWGINPLENTDFKVGFMGVPPDFEKRHIYSLSRSRMISLVGGVARQFAVNPGYLNRSLLDSVGSFFSRSIMPHTDYYHLYDYVRWDEDEIENVLFGTYDWERACDTETTWRIGDGTAAFYNYIYYTVAGFSEHDTFRSNQVREGAISRERAVTLAERDNQPRYPTLKWYLQIINLDYGSTIRRINSIPKLY